MNKLQQIFILLITIVGFAQSPTTKSSPATTAFCAKNSTDYQELSACFNEFLNKEIRKSFIVGDIMKDIPYDIKLMISFKLDSLEMLHVSKISMLRHTSDSTVISKSKMQMEKVFNRINEKTKRGEGFAAAKDKNGNAVAYE